MRTPALIFVVAGFALILWGLASAPEKGKSFMDTLTRA